MTSLSNPAKYGHIAAALREFLTTKGWRPVKLTEELGGAITQAGVYNWLSAKNAPAREIQKKLSTITGLPISTWRPNLPAQSPEKPAAKLQEKPVMVTNGHRVLPTADPLVISFTPDGHVRVKLDILCPTSQAMPLINLLLNHGLMTKEPDESA